MFKPTFDIYKDLITPNILLCNIDNSIIGSLKVTDLQLNIEHDGIDDISFKIYRQYQSEITGDIIIQPYFDKIEAMRNILIEGIGRFHLDEPILTKTNETEYKTVRAESTEVELQDSYLKSFYINTGDIISIDSVSLLNDSDPNHSLLHLILKEIPHWGIGHIDVDIRSIQRHFEIDRQDIYSFLRNNFSEAFNTYVEFDTVDNLINIYNLDNYGNDTDVFISHDVLAKETTIKHSRENIKTYVTVTGKDGLGVREVNIGADGIWNLTYYHSREWMDEELYNAYSAYLNKVSTAKTLYTNALQSLNLVYLEKEELINRFPKNNLNSNIWNEHGLQSLQSRKNDEELVLATMLLSGMNSKEHPQHSRYITQVDIVSEVIENMNIRQSEVDSKNSIIAAKEIELNDIATTVVMKNNFSNTQLIALGRFKKEDEYKNEYYLTVDNEDESSVLATKLELLKAGEKYLDEKASPQYEFEMTMVNIFNITDFERMHSQFQVGNYIHIGIGDNNIVSQVRLLKIHIEFDNPENFSVKFGNFSHKNFSNNVIGDNSMKALLTVQTQSLKWGKTTSTINNYINNLPSSDSTAEPIQNVISEKEKIFFNGSTLSSVNGEFQCIFGGNGLVYSNDGFMTAQSLLGIYEKDGELYYGVIAGKMNNGVIDNSRINNSTFNGGQVNGATLKNVTIDGKFFVPTMLQNSTNSEETKYTSARIIESLNVIETLKMIDGKLVSEYGLDPTELHSFLKTYYTHTNSITDDNLNNINLVQLIPHLVNYCQSLSAKLKGVAVQPEIIGINNNLSK